VAPNACCGEWQETIHDKVLGMAAFDNALATQIKQRAAAKLAEIVAALERTLGIANTAIHWGDTHAWTSGTLGEEFVGQGLVMQLAGKTQQAALLIGGVGGYLPDWFTSPDQTQKVRLIELAQELGMLLLPEEWDLTQFHAAAADDLETALEAAGFLEQTGCLPFTLNSSAGKCSGLLVLPVQDAGRIFSAGTPAIRAAAKAAPQKATTTAAPTSGRVIPTYDRLPKYTRSLLKIDVPLRVVLAEKKQSLAAIMELGPGSIIQFTKSCEDLLELHVENQVVAQGEAVKVGDKFGLRITSMVMPEERFLTIKTTTAR
jgi:flagellar motor switch/type III secretory pathway protein FliN